MPEAKPTAKQFNYLTLVIATLIIALLASLVTFTLYQKTIILTARITDQNSMISSLTKQISAQEAQLQNYKIDITQLHTVTKKLAGNRNEASFAVQMAIYELELLQNYAKTIEYLNLALLHNSNVAIEKKITTAIADLKEISQFNVITKLDELDQIKAKLVTPVTPPAKITKTKSKLNNNKVVNFLNTFVTISYTESTNKPQLFRSNQQHMVEATMLALINQAKSALANKHDGLLHTSITKLKHILATHFDPSPQIKAIASELAELDKLTLNPKTPDLQTILNDLYSNMSSDAVHAPATKKSPESESMPAAKHQTSSPHITAEF